MEPPPDKTTLKTPPIPTPIPVPLELSLSWSRVSRRHLPDPKMAPSLKKVIQTALQTALQMAPPLYPALKNQLLNKVSSPFAIDFSMVDDDRIEQLNARYRGKNRPTDVLSFALWEESDEAETEGDEAFVFPDFGSAFSSDFGAEIALGDIVISTQTAARQALEQGHVFEREIAFLTIHGALHLLGYDHGKDGARRVMFARQDEIFAAVFAAEKAGSRL